MAYEKLVDIFDISRSMFMYPWLEYPDRTKEFRKAMAPVHLPLSCYKMPKDELPPSPECWRQHPSKPNSVPCCYSKKPEIYTHWHTLYDQRKARKAQKMLLKMRDHPKYLKDSSQAIYLPMSKLTIKSQVGAGPLEPTSNPLKWQRLQELTKILKSREDDQFYATQALGYLGINDKFIMEALWQVAQTGPKKVKHEAYRTLAILGEYVASLGKELREVQPLLCEKAEENGMRVRPLQPSIWQKLRTILGCLNKQVIQALILQLKEESEHQGMETLTGLRVALNSWAAVPKDKRTHIGDEEELVLALQTLMKSSSGEAALEAALCLGFLRPCSNMAQEFLLQCLCQGPKTQQMQALRMLVKIMHVHSAAVTRAILAQLRSSSVVQDRFEATQMLRTIGLEKIKAQELEELTFDLLKWKTHYEPFFAMRQAVAETVEELRMKPMMMKLVEAQLMDPDATTRQQAVISLGVLGIRGPQVFHLLLDMLDTEQNQAVKKSIPKTNEKTTPKRFQKETENSGELNIQDFRFAKLNPLFITKASTKD